MRAEVAKRRAGPGSPLSFLFVAVFVDMIGYGIVVPLLPFYAREHASGAVLVGLLGSLYAAAQFVGGPSWAVFRTAPGAAAFSSSACSARRSRTCCSAWPTPYLC